MDGPASPLLGLGAAAAALAFGTLALGTLALGQGPALPIHPVVTVTPVGFLTQPIPDTTPNAELLRRGRVLAIEGDCMGCHVRDGGEPFAGGLGLRTPFGLIYTANITSDPTTGIGAWTSDQFYRAMHDGIGAHGENLYPAFPYPEFSRVTRADDDAIFAYLKTTPPVSYTPPANGLPFPLNIRFLVSFWNLLFFRPHDFQADVNQTPEWNHGAYLVEGLGHCGACHTPKNLLAADVGSRPLQGGELDNWVAPDLTGNPHTGLGRWSVDDIVEYMETGRNALAGAGGSMAEVVTDSTSLLSDEDRRDIAAYLKSLSPSPEPAPRPVDPGAMQRGAAVYSDACASCHLVAGVGQPRYFPPLGHAALLQQSDPVGLEHLILGGDRVAVTPTRPTPLAMPSFAWKLSDGEVADVSTYIRNTWGNQAPPVSASSAGTVRHNIGLDTLRLTVNSGDHGAPR